MTAGIVLAGGSSRRFPPNKLALVVDGETLLVRSMRAVAAVCDELVVVIGASAAAPALPELDLPVRIVADAVPDGGPLAGIDTGLAATAAEWAVVSGGDMPSVPHRLLRAMLERALETGADAVALREGDRTRPFPCVLRVPAARPVAAALLAAGERRPRALLAALAADLRDEEWWRARDPAGDWRRDVDVPEDLGR